MKQVNTAMDADMDKLGRHLSGQLSLASPDLSHDIAERLRVARQLAIGHRPPAAQVRHIEQNQIQTNGTLTTSGDEGLGVWSVLASSVPLLALVVGLLTIQWAKDEHIALEIAATDSALLTDELPPHAYTDAGFAQFLKLNPSAPSQND
ncbi:DUF3619 family protein [Limnohabitans sp. DCL3]|uniref:DUF3619 family protein n=1 Tax=Limnohabitans sp. DCL3 TaxID=3374103 RepID=UPI003A8AEA3F